MLYIFSIVEEGVNLKYSLYSLYIFSMYCIRFLAGWQFFLIFSPCRSYSSVIGVDHLIVFETNQLRNKHPFLSTFKSPLPPSVCRLPAFPPAGDATFSHLRFLMKSPSFRFRVVSDHQREHEIVRSTKKEERPRFELPTLGIASGWRSVAR